MWHHQIWGQFAGYAAGYASSGVLMPASVCIVMLWHYAYFSAHACLYCLRSLNCFYNAYTV